MYTNAFSYISYVEKVVITSGENIFTMISVEFLIGNI